MTVVFWSGTPALSFLPDTAWCTLWHLSAWTQHCYSCLPAALEAEEAAELNDGTTITVSLEPGLDEIFEEGSRRLLEKSTWKLWQWPPEQQEFFDADSFR